MKRPAQQEAIQGLLVDCCAKLSAVMIIIIIRCTTLSAIMIAQVVSLSHWLSAWSILHECKGFFPPCDGWVMICSCSISHKEKISTYILPRRWNSLQLFDCPATQKSIPVIMFSRAEQMISMQEAVDSTFQLCFWLGKVFMLVKPHPTLPHSSRFPLLLWERTTCLYILVLLSDNGPLSALLGPWCEIKEHQKLRSSWSELLRKTRPWTCSLAVAIDLSITYAKNSPRDFFFFFEIEQISFC